MYTRDSHHTVSIPVATEGSMSSPPTDCKLEQNTSFVPWDNPYDLISHKQAYRNLVGESSVLLQYLVGLTGFLFASQFLSCVIACERCFCVVSPFKAQKYFKTSTMAVIISVVCFVLVAGIWVIAGNKHIVVCEFDPVTNRTSNVLAFTSSRENTRKEKESDSLHHFHVGTQ
ncbi:hypothetical protein C0Q70_13543 [Pomacea canaliculata]|uniref:Uncharacterized protein n=1 Tax=Pomacea canaliculata TaxID=400727 RepID=A0A2T7NXI6_POMCA|nr:hypothetical protein C0Q70_13543 [Pomacea canaliculata]